MKQRLKDFQVTDEMTRAERSVVYNNKAAYCRMRATQLAVVSVVLAVIAIVFALAPDDALGATQPTRADVAAADELDLFAIKLDRMSWRALTNDHLTRSVVLHDAADKAHERAAVLRHGA